jgi:Ca2+:H+ antiporter
MPAHQTMLTGCGALPRVGQRLKRLGVFDDGEKLKNLLLTRWECSIERLCERKLSVYLTLPDPTICCAPQRRDKQNSLTAQERTAAFLSTVSMANLFHRNQRSTTQSQDGQDIEMKASTSPAVPENAHHPPEKHHILPTHRVNHNGHKVTKHITPEGESGRRGVHPLHFFRIAWRSTSDASRAVNVLWPAVPAAIAVRYARPDLDIAIFTLSYIAMVPCANLIGFAGQELARKLPRVFGILTETTLGSVVEIVLFMVLLHKNEFQVIQAAIMGSILATLLMCLGMCFFVGGLRRDEQSFEETISEVGSGLLLTA